MIPFGGRSEHRLPTVGCVLALVASLGSAAAAGAASGTALPNPCALLTSLHPEATLAPGKSVAGRKLTNQGTGAFATSTCQETVGALPVYLSVGHNFGGFGGIKVTSITHPGGLGSGDELVVGTGFGSTGPVDFIVFHKGTTYADLSANGAKPTSLTTLARQLYKLLH